MGLVQFNQDLQDTVYAQLKSAPSGLFGLEVQFYSTSNPNANDIVSPKYIKNLAIFQDYRNHVTDVMTITMDLTPLEFIHLYTMYEDLTCKLTAFAFSEAWKALELYPAWEFTYKALILGMEDILKQININEIMPTENNPIGDSTQSVTLPIAFQLVSEDVYEHIKSSVNFTIKNATIKQLIYAVANTIGIDNVYMPVEPDNTQVYPQLTIPPVQNLATVYPEIQKTYGIYRDGLGYYYANGRLYLYPAYRVNPENDYSPIANFYKIPDKELSGLYGYTSMDANGNLHVVSNLPVSMKDTAAESVENVGNHIVTLNTDKVLDLNRTVHGGNNNSSFEEDNLIHLTMDGVRGNTKNMSVFKYVKGTNNAYEMSSNLMEQNFTQIEITWNNPLPYTLRPGQQVIYHYEDDLGYKTKKGILVGVSYVYTVATRNDQGYIYGGVGKAVLRLASDSEELVSDNEGNSTSQSGGSIFDTITDISMNALKNLF